jgi:hypothetical protein
MPPGTGFSFRLLLGLAGLRWWYSNPPTHRSDWLNNSKSKSKLLYAWRFTAYQFVLASSPLRLTTRDFFPNWTLLWREDGFVCYEYAWPQSQSQSHIATDGQSISKSWRRAHDIYCSLTVTVLFLWGALSHERTGLSFVHAAGPRQVTFLGSESLGARDHILLSLCLAAAAAELLVVLSPVFTAVKWKWDACHSITFSASL